MKSSKKLVKIALKKIQHKALQISIGGVPSGFVEIDEFTDGWQPGQLIVIAARPGMGKSAFAKSMILKTAINFDQAVAVFSIECSAIQYMNRMIASETKMSYSRLTYADFEVSELTGLKTKLKILSRAPIFIDDTPGISLSNLKHKLLKLKSKKDIKLVVIDYLQLMTLQKISKYNRIQEIDLISRGLNELARELDLPIIILSQLPSSVEARKSKRPKLKDLREITTIEKYADIVAFLYRPEYYGIEKWDNSRETTEGQAEFIIAKNRNRYLNSFKLKFNLIGSYFSDIENR